MARHEPNEVLKRLRGEKTRKEVASAVGITERALKSYELGDRIPRDDVKQKLANFYDVTVTYLFF